MGQYFPVSILNLPVGAEVLATDVYPAVDVTDHAESNVGTCKQYNIGQLIDAISGLITINQTTTPVTLMVNTTYVCSAGSDMINFILPEVIPFGSFFQIIGKDSGLFQISQTSGQSINFGDVTTTTGMSGSIVSTNSNDCIRFVCTVANTTLTVISSIGDLTVS
jgi:hypothetical protein